MKEGSIFIETRVVNPEKIGDGVNAYLRYTIKTKTNHPSYNGTEFEVQRRYREFHALYETLVDIYRDKGYHIPHPPEKSLAMSARVKLLHKDPNDIFQIDMRRILLESFLQRLLLVKVLAEDKTVIDFLTSTVTTVKPRDNLIKLKQNISVTFSSLGPDSDDYESWYNERIDMVFDLERSLSKLFYIFIDLLACRRDFIYFTKRFADSLAKLKATEQNDSIGAAFSAIMELKEESCRIQEKQCLNEARELVCTSRDVLDDIISVKHLLSTYGRKFDDVKGMMQKIDKLRQKQVRLEAIGNAAEVQPVKTELEELEKRHIFQTNCFHEFSDTMKISLEHFDKQRTKETKEAVLNYLKKLKQTQEELLVLYEKVLPVCQSIH